MRGLTLHLVRHASHDLLGRVLAGRSDVPLNAKGLREAELLADVFVRQQVSAVISSPQLRARATAKPIASRCGIPFQLNPGLDEINFGAWTGMTFDDLGRDPGWQVFNTARSLAAVPGGETMLAAQARAIATVQRICEQLPGGVMVMVSHADIIKAILLHILGMPLDMMRRLEIAPASRSVVFFTGGDCVVRAINIPVTEP
ncbi:MAG: histidine phosphatase family protein [Acetobacteraceae bacterium]|nr:histidine phosphatase family protein [Acetobacteraceae bacterium]